MPLGTLRSVKLLSDIRCNGGEWQATLPFDPRRPPRLRTRFDGFWRTHHLSVAVAATWAGLALAVPGRVLELTFVAPASTLEFRILDLTDAEPSELVQLTAVGIEFDLQRRSLYVHDVVNGVPVLTPSDGGITVAAALQARVIAVGPSYGALGTVTPTGAISVQHAAGASAWDAGSAIAQAVRDQLQATYELEFVRNGTTDYRLNFVVIGSSATSPDVRSRKNLLRFERIRSLEGQATRVQVLDASSQPLIGRAVYAVNAVSAGVHVDIEDLAGGPAPAGEADQFNGQVLVDDAGGEHTITDTQVLSPTLTRLLMSSTTGVAAGELVRLMRPGKLELLALDSPSLQGAPSQYGILLRTVQAPQLDGGTNLLGKNTDVGIGTPPDGWVETGTGTLVMDTTRYLTGGRSAKLVPSNPGLKGIYKQATHYFVTAETVVFSTWLYQTAGTWVARVHCQVDGVEIAGSPIDVTSPTPNTWMRIDAAPVLVAAGAHTLKLWVENVVIATTELWVDAGQALNLPTPMPFRVGSHPARAIQRANSLFATTGHPIEAYRVRVSDEARRDPTAYPFDGFEFGATMAVRATALDASITPRIVSMDQNLLDPRDTAVELNVIRPEFVQLTAQGSR